VLQYVAVCCNVLSCAEVCYTCLAACCSVLQCVAVCCSVLQCIAVCCSVSQAVSAVSAVCCSVLQCVVVLCSASQCIPSCYRRLQCDAVCCSVLQCVAVYNIYSELRTNIKTQSNACRSVLKHSVLKTHCNILQHPASSGNSLLHSRTQTFRAQNGAGVCVCCSVLQCVAAFLQCVAVCCSEHIPCSKWRQCVCVVYCIVLQCAAVCCSVVQCAAVWCSVLRHLEIGDAQRCELQCVAVCV